MKKEYFLPTSEQALACRIVEESLMQHRQATGHYPEAIYASYEVFRLFGPGPLEIHGAIILFDKTLDGFTCYARKRAHS